MGLDLGVVLAGSDYLFGPEGEEHLFVAHLLLLLEAVLLLVAPPQLPQLLLDLNYALLYLGCGQRLQLLLHQHLLLAQLIQAHCPHNGVQRLDDPRPKDHWLYDLPLSVE